MTPPEDVAELKTQRARLPRTRSSSHARTATCGVSDVRVLIVDDHDDTRRMFAEYLAWHGALTLEANSVAEALVVLQREVVHVVVTDVAMPREDGYALLARMDAAPAWASIPRIVVSGHSSVMEASERAPRATYLKKPIDLDRLLEAIAASYAHAER
ncbi:response regulator [Sandaracinus amylolyticus]|uniref:response regulator n=1 Tax=Sandaracinus amylolyticus TaxID=927083 RepID=UPI00147048AA|nr:response regulator [Sandaracinus amylolyticus]